MSESEILLDYHGQVDLKVIEILLKRLRQNKEFTLLNRLTAKRVYSIVVECLENIFKNTIEFSSPDPKMDSHISVSIKHDRIYIVSGNPVPESAKESLSKRLDRLNCLNETDLRALHEKRINREPVQGENGAGLGFICMSLKSRNKIDYKFKPLKKDYLYFEIKVLLNKYNMRKLIIDKTSSTPNIVLDPERNIYMISGESRPPDVREFYDQIISWLHEFGKHLSKMENIKDPVVFDFNLEYFNSSSGKLILDICKVLAGLHLSGINIRVNWHFEKEDEDMLEAGKEMSKIVKIPFEYVES